MGEQYSAIRRNIDPWPFNDGLSARAKVSQKNPSDSIVERRSDFVQMETSASRAFSSISASDPLAI